MVSKSTKGKPVELSIEEILGKPDEITKQKQVIKRVLNIPYMPDKKPKAFRIFKEGIHPLLYASTREGNLKENAEENPDGYLVDVTNLGELLGKKCELKDIAKKEVVLQGIITEKKAQSNVISMPAAEAVAKKASNS